MSQKTTFEQLCAGKIGYACDENSHARLTKQESFDDLIFKVLTKCETNLIFLPSPTCTIKLFTVDIITDFTNSSIAAAWAKCEQQGYDGMSVVASLDSSNMPEVTTTRYSFGQFVNSVIHRIEAHFMFQKHNPHFHMNALSLWNTSDDDVRMKTCAVILAWKFNRKPLEEVLNRSPLSQLNSSVHKESGGISTPNQVTRTKSTVVKTTEKRRKTITSGEVSTPIKSGRIGRKSLIEPPVNNASEESADDDPDISFKRKPEDIIPQVRYLSTMTPGKTTKSAEPMEVVASAPEPIVIEDVTLGFETPQASKGGRKSTARKSLVPDWPDVEKQHILEFFDNLNPEKAEQTRVALTCKFAQMQYDRELPSKLLYQWIQKKGREVKRTITNYKIPEAEQNKATLDLYKELNPNTSEVSRVAFICKFVNMQYGISLNSREFTDLLNGKVKKTSKRR